MPLPAGITGKTVTVGIPTRFNGQPATGSATLTLPVNLVHTPTGTPLFSGRQTKQFTGLSEVQFTDLVPTDAPGLNRVDWTYTLEVRVNGAVEQPEPITFVLLSAGPDTIDADTLVTVPSSAGTPVSVAAVTSVAGLTGALTAQQTVTALDVPLRAAFVPAFVLAGPGIDPTGATDSTAALQAKIDAAPDGATLFLPLGTYKLTAALTITKSLTLVGAGVRAAYSSLNTVFAFDMPPTITGTVLVQSTAATDAIQITKAGAHVDLRDFGIRFDGSHRFTNTGHGINATPSTTYGAGHDHGLMNSTWSAVMVFGHDGNHYAAQFVNPLLNTVRGLRSWGGGVMRVACDSNAGNYGNMVVEHPYGLLLAGGTAHGYSLEGRTGSGTSGVLNLMTFIRPQCNSSATAGGAGVAATSSQHLFRADNPVSVVNLAVLNPDFECGSGLTNPVAFGGGDAFIDPSGLFGATSDTASKAFTVFRSEFGARRLNSDMTISNVNTPAPTAAVMAGAGTGSPSISISGGDMAGAITLTAGTAPTAFSDLAEVTFGHIPSFTAVTLIPRNGNAAAAGAYIRSKGATSFRFGTSAAPTAGQSYQWDFIVSR